MEKLSKLKNPEKLIIEEGKQLFFADLQIHSRYARACSSAITIQNLAKWGKIKGLHVMGVGDFQHPEWCKEIDAELVEDDNGVLWFKDGGREPGTDVAFLWQTEVSLMFSQGGKRRAVHLLLFAPNTRVADAITSYLGSKGRLDYDGRPIFGMTCRDLVKDLKDIDADIEIIPAHCMTPWFGLFGSKSGFDSLAECFGDQVEHINAIESGMSADPAMLWRFAEVASGKARVVSFSDAHSFWPWRLGREATVFSLKELSYGGVMHAIRTGEGLTATIETPPSYGKYHWDGHRNCHFSCSPAESKKLNGVCPKCGKGLTIGVDYRVEEVAANDDGFVAENGAPFYWLLPLHELISLHTGVSMNSKRVWKVFDSLIAAFGNEFRILLDVTREQLLQREVDARLVELIMLNRTGALSIEPGFDGEYGAVQMPEGFEKSENAQQKTLF